MSSKTGKCVPTGPGEEGLVSVVIPTYNRAHLLGQAIQSVVQQSYSPVEIIVADDGSTDRTREVVSGYGPAVRYLQQTNGGVSAARNLGLERVRGEFVALLDSDDQWLPWKLAAQVALMRRCPEVGMVWTDMTAVDNEQRVLHEAYLRGLYSNHQRYRIEDICQPMGALGAIWPVAPAGLAARPYYRGDIFLAMFMGNLVHTPTVLLRRSRLERVGLFDESLRFCGEDYEFHLRTCAAGAVAYIDAPSILYRIGCADQMTAPRYGVFSARNNLRTVLRCVRLERARLRAGEALIRQRLGDAFGWLGEEELMAGEVGRGINHLWRGLRINPAQPRRALILMRWAMCVSLAQSLGDIRWRVLNWA